MSFAMLGFDCCCPYSTPLDLDLGLGLFSGRQSRLGAWAWAWARRGAAVPHGGAAVAMASGREPVDPGPR